MSERIRISPPSPEQATRNLELTRRQEWRQNFLVPIYVMWTSNVPEAEAQAAKQGVIDTVKASGQKREIIVFGSNPFNHSNQPFSSPDWYIDETIKRQALRRDAGFGPQVDVSEVTRLFYEEPYQEQPHWEVFIVNHDLNGKQDGKYINFVFGSTSPIFPASIQSVTRLIGSVRPNDLKLAMVRRLLRHEVGHMFWLPSRSHNVEENLGRHCTSQICTMKQGITIDAWAKQTSQEENSGIYFCNDCLADFARLQPRYKPLPASNE